MGDTRYAIRENPWRSGHASRFDELCLFEALYPTPLARPFFKGLLNWQVRPFTAIRDSSQTRSPLEKGAAKGRDRLPRRGRTHRSEKWANGRYAIQESLVTTDTLTASRKLCLFEALYPAPSARPFFKGLLRWHATL